MGKAGHRGLVAMAGVALLASMSHAGFTSGRLAVVLMGDGSGALSNAATLARVFEFDKTTLGQSGTIIVSAPMTNAGNATSEGFLTLSSDRMSLLLAGYDAALGTVSVVSTASVTVNRTIQSIAADGSVILTKFSDAYSGGNIRSAISNGTNFWMSGTSASANNPGVRVNDLGNLGATIQVAAAPTNIRVVNAFNGDLYFSSAQSGNVGINVISGMPTTSGNTVTNLFDSTSGTGTPSVYDFWFADANTAYLADDRSLVNGGGLQKWVFAGGAWSLSATYTTGLTAGLRGLAGEIVDGQTILYATTADAITATAGNSLVRLVDVGTGSAFDILATAPGYTAFRGVELTPEAVPEPATLAALGVGALGLLARRRKR